MNHKIINNHTAFKEFIQWLPELEQYERYYLCLQARKKYMPSLKSSDKTQLRRIVTKKEDIYHKVFQLESRIGAYTTKDKTPIPDQAIALYITINPRCLRKATITGIQSLTKAIANDLDNGMKRNCPNPHSEIMSAIHKAKSRTCFVDFDIDQPNDNLKEIKNKMNAIVGHAATSYIVTRGGVHVLVNPQQVISKTKNWHPIVCRTLNSDQTGDLMIPVPGCNQGGFTPRLEK